MFFVCSPDHFDEYVLEDLWPATTYDLRFSLQTRFGSSEWSRNQQITTAGRGRPEPPVINRNAGEGEEMVDGVIELDDPDQYEISWHIPEDNGVPIDYFLLTYYAVRCETLKTLDDIL